jgi:hypothetical protein
VLKIESETARGNSSSAHDTVTTIEQDCGDLQLSIPYFGIINIGGKGITKNRQTGLSPLLPLSAGESHTTETFNGDFTIIGSGDTLLRVSNVGSIPAQPALLNNVNEGFDHDQVYPGLAAGVDDWAFQGVDGAFFDSLMLGNADWNPIS